MNAASLNSHIRPVDERRDLAVPGDKYDTLDFCVQHWLDIGALSIKTRGKFCVALSGGSTPKAIFQSLSSSRDRNSLDWSKVYLFWSDERSVDPDHSDSNYLMAMTSGLGSLPIPDEQIFRMEAEDTIERNAERYERCIREHCPDGKLDLVMLGMGDDGHTASLFPETKGLSEIERMVIANHVPQKETWRMTFSYRGIHNSRHIAIYVLGKGKEEMLKDVLFGEMDTQRIPSQGVGQPDCKALWIADQAAAAKL